MILWKPRKKEIQVIDYGKSERKSTTKLNTGIGTFVTTDKCGW